MGDDIENCQRANMRDRYSNDRYISDLLRDLFLLSPDRFYAAPNMAPSRESAAKRAGVWATWPRNIFFTLVS